MGSFIVIFIAILITVAVVVLTREKKSPHVTAASVRQAYGRCCLMEFYILATSKVIPSWTLTCDRVLMVTIIVLPHWEIRPPAP